MPTTTYLGLTYPALSNAPNVPQDMQNLASGVDTKVSGVILCTSGTRPTTREGAVIYETDTDRMAKYTGSAWEYLAGSRISYTPTLTASTSNPTLGTGSSRFGWYSYIPGPCIVFSFHILFGSSGVGAGSGGYSVSLPVTAGTPTAGGNLAIGSIMLADASAGTFKTGSIFLVNGATTCSMLAEGSALVNNGSPWVWAAGDYLSGTVTYPL